MKTDERIAEPDEPAAEGDEPMTEEEARNNRTAWEVFRQCI